MAFGRLGAIGKLGSMGGGGGARSIAPGAVILTWDADGSDTTPNFGIVFPAGNTGSNAHLNAAVNDVLRMQYSTDGVVWSAYLTHTLDAGDVAGTPLTVSGVTPLASGTYFFRGRLERVALLGPWSASASATISATPPVATFITSSGSTGTDVTQTVSSVDFGSSTAAADIFVVLGLTTAGSNGDASGMTITPNGGSPIAGTLVKGSTGGAPFGWLFKCVIPSGTTGINNCVITATFSTNPFSSSYVSLWTVPLANISSQTPVDTDAIRNTGATVGTLDISTSVGGFYIAIAATSGFFTSFAWTGDDSPTERYDAVQSGGQSSGADASSTTAHTNDNTITATSPDSGSRVIVAASWR